MMTESNKLLWRCVDRETECVCVTRISGGCQEDVNGESEWRSELRGEWWGPR